MKMSRTNQAASQSNSSKEMGPAGCKDVQNVILFAKYKWTTARCSHLIVELKHHSQHACCRCCSWTTFCWIVKTFCTHRAGAYTIYLHNMRHIYFIQFQIYFFSSFQPPLKISNVLMLRKTKKKVDNYNNLQLLCRLPRAGGVPQPQRGGGDGE